jgi:hypothetical protein
MLLEIVHRWLPLWLFALILPPLAAAALVLYASDRARVSGRRGWVLTGMRVLVLFVLAVLLLDLARVETSTVKLPGEVMVVIDESRSMAATDSFRAAEEKRAEALALAGGAAGSEATLEALEGKSRLDLARLALDSGWLEELRERHRITLYALSGGLRPLSPGATEGGEAAALRAAIDGLAAEGAETNLVEPLLDEVFKRSGAPPAAILLLSDGQHNAGRDPRQAARALGLLGVPLIAVGIGAAERPRDAAIIAVDATSRVFAGDEIEVEVAIDASGLGAVPLALGIAEAERQIAGTTVELPPGDGLSRWPLRFPAGPPGRRKLTTSFPPLEGEASSENNRRDFWIEVLSDEARVLLLDGGPRWEHRYLKSTWERDEKVELSSFLVSPPPDRRLPQDFPRERAALFAHDVIVLGDVASELFAPDERERLAEFVTARGGTLVLIAGSQAMPHSWQGTALEPLLPVELASPAPPRGLGAELARGGPRLSLAAEGEVSPLTRLVAGRERNIELWELLPAPRWIAPVKGLRSGSVELVALKLDGGERAVFATRAQGAGKVFYSGIDSTWRWRFRFGDEFYRKFWGQVIRWAVAERLSAADDHVRLGSDRLLYEPPLRLEIAALVERAPGEPIEDDLVDAVITCETGSGEGAVRRTRRLRLEAVPKSGGRYRGLLEAESLAALFDAPVPAPPGEPVELRVRLAVAALPGYGEREDRAELALVVVPPPSPEGREPARNAALLEELAGLTSGAYLPLARFREAAERIPDRSRLEEQRRVTALLDWPLVLAGLFVGLLGLEWILRKRWELM